MAVHMYPTNRLTISNSQNMEQWEFLHSRWAHELELLWKSVWDHLVKIIHKSGNPAHSPVAVHTPEIRVQVQPTQVHERHSSSIHGGKNGKPPSLEYTKRGTSTHTDMDGSHKQNVEQKKSDF